MKVGSVIQRLLVRWLVHDELEKFKAEADLTRRFEEVSRRVNEMKEDERRQWEVINQRVSSLERHRPQRQPQR